jgi:hypothetical protein
MRVLALEGLRDDRGQSSLDFIFGFGVFLLTFIFAITFVASMFLPFQPGAIDLSSVAYRTSALLVEDPGWYIGVNGIPAGITTWEKFPLNVTEATGAGLRIGLANNKSTPNMLSIDKINAFDALAKDNYSIARDKMGLNGSIEYDFNILLTMNRTIPNGNQSNGKNVTLLSLTSPYSHSNNVELLDRKVMVSMGKQLFIDANKSHNDAEQWVNISNITPDNYKNLTIRIYNPPDVVHVDEVGWSTVAQIEGPVTWSYGDDYLVFLNGEPVFNFVVKGVNINKTDILEIVVINSAIRDPMGNLDPSKKFIYVHTNSTIFLGGSNGTDYFSDPAYRLTDVYYPATLRLEIWSYEFA